MKCRWLKEDVGIACYRGNGGRGCESFRSLYCAYPGFESSGFGVPPCETCNHVDAPALPRRLRPLPPRNAVVRDRPRPVGWKGRELPSCHIACADLEELHRIAAICELKREWFQEKPYPHYDVFGATHLSLVHKHTKRVSRFDLVRVAREAASD